MTEWTLDKQLDRGGGAGGWGILSGERKVWRGLETGEMDRVEKEGNLKSGNAGWN